MLRITVDTNILTRQMERIREAVEGLDVEIAQTTVTLREEGMDSLRDDSFQTSVSSTASSSGSFVTWGPSPPVYESLVLGESRLGMAVLGGDDSSSRFEAILAIIGSGSFPKRGERDDLTNTQRRQLRDAMMLEAHARDGRDILVSEDRRAFIGKDGKKRAALEALCATKIRTVDEFCREVAKLAGRQLDTPT